MAETDDRRLGAWWVCMKIHCQRRFRQDEGPGDGWIVVHREVDGVLRQVPYCSLKHFVRCEVGEGSELYRSTTTMAAGLAGARP